MGTTSKSLPTGKKKRNAELRRRGEELKARYPKKRTPLVCPLCGDTLARGTLLDHKALVHGEKHVARGSQVQPHRDKARVPFVSGGLPGLGKHRASAGPLKRGPSGARPVTVRRPKLGAPVVRCRHCGHPALPGDDVCYTHSAT
jgi:ribosomal protein S27E